jgi:CHAT domain-containing protein
LQAGVPAVVGTLWPVNDLSTMLLMVRFYRYHLKGDETTGEGPMPPAGALRRAQLWLRDVTNAELAELFRSYRDCGSELSASAIAQKQFTYYTNCINQEDQPFAHPYHWAAFAFYGV